MDQFKPSVGFAAGSADFNQLTDYDFGHFVLFGNHLAALLDNVALIAELDGERLELSASNSQLDISLRNLQDAHAKLLQSTQTLAEVSRRAGMADIATGVLHNVGNTLNSVNVSAELAASRLRTLKISGVARVAELLTQNSTDLVTYLGQDERGRKIPLYLAELAAHLTSETGSIAQELHTLEEHIDHIKSIVSKQQAYASTLGVTEPCVPSRIIEDAIGLTKGSLAPLGIEVTCDFCEMPELLLDRHKVLQILVNLLSNAKHALAECPSTTKQIKVWARLSSNERLLLSVDDNGAGISPEHMSRMFTHGFTTKKRGHGFGLHTSAIAAKEMGGALTCNSQGSGFGATFILDLPARAPSVRAAQTD